MFLRRSSQSPSLLHWQQQRGFVSAQPQLITPLSPAVSSLFEPISSSEVKAVLSSESEAASPQSTEIVWATAIKRNVRISLKKLTQVAKQIRGLNYYEAVGQLSFLQLRVAPTILQLVKQAKSNGENLHGWDPSRMIVDLQIGKGQTGRQQLDIRGRGKHGIRRTTYSHIRARIRVVPEVEGERRVGKFGLTHRSIPKKPLSVWEVDEKIETYKANKEADHKARLQRGKELIAQAKKERAVREAQRAKAPEEAELIESRIPIRRKLNIHDLNPKIPKEKNIVQNMKNVLVDEMDQEYMDQLQAYFEPKDGESTAAVTVENLRDILQKKVEAKERIQRRRIEAVEELERKKKVREEAIKTQKQQEQQEQEKKAVAQEKRNQKKQEHEEEVKRLRELLKQQKAAKGKK